MASEQQIDETIDALRAKWKRYPTLRLCQLITNAVQPGCVSDVFYVDDEKFKRRIETYGPDKASSL